MKLGFFALGVAALLVFGARHRSDRAPRPAEPPMRFAEARYTHVIRWLKGMRPRIPSRVE